nr:zinc finger, CCHC-type [Tanacetum cinerariifolium]
MSVVYVLTTLIIEDDDDATVEQLRKRAKWDNNDYVCSGLILNDFKHTLKHLKEELTLVELGSHLRIEESLRVQDSDKPKGNNVVGPSVVNMVKHNNSSRYSDNKGKRNHDNIRVDPNKKAKPTCWKCGKTYHIKRDCKCVNVDNKANGSDTKGSVDGSSNSLKGQNMFNKSLQIYYVTYVSEAYFVQDDDVVWGGEYTDTMYIQSFGIILETTPPYTPQQNGISERKNKVLKEMINSMLSYSGLRQWFWGEAMLTARHLLNKVPNKRNRITPYV